MGSPAFSPIQLTQFKPEDLQDPNLAVLNQWVANITKAANASTGTGGPVTIPSGIDVKGATISNVGGVGPEHEAVSKSYAEKNYSAAALAPQLEGGGKNALKSVRRVNDSNQKEQFSGFLDNIMSTAPTTNSATISGSGDSVTVSSGFHYHTSGQVVPFAMRSDTVSLPPNSTISTLVRTSSVVLVTTVAAHGLAPGDVVNISGASDPSFDGQFVVASTPTLDTFTYVQVASNATATGGTSSEGSIFYYYLPVNKTVLSMAGPFPTDSQANRLSINKDGTVLVAVASFSGGGFNSVASAAGATPPPATSGNHILTRL